ncbi:hypothetical protein EV207_12155 [Scopulibacillus darangshiensis]|uniref:Uncharacterized protein n=1 Tax=Scopulibacillus darangshiensis TaxID=442528 RepID=A0A4R2NW29_9BACL|nr:hypothetical protein EV207_12155 [Scopulibacillus darangshiensis]
MVVNNGNMRDSCGNSEPSETPQTRNELEEARGSPAESERISASKAKHTIFLKKNWNSASMTF